MRRNSGQRNNKVSSRGRSILGSIIASCCIAFLFSCASVVVPSGGPKDITPPVVEKITPPNYSAGFDAKTITFSFNEFIQIKDAQNQCILSPPLPHTPDIKVKGKDLIVTFKDSLATQTTYTLNFGNAISDITEGNINDGVQYVFSTGIHLDSLRITGTVINAATRQPEKGVLVMLYRNTADSTPYKTRPDYFTRTNESGLYKISHIARGTYKLFALKDANGNYLYDQPGELIAFCTNLITPAQNDTSYNMTLFKELPETIRMVKASHEGYGKILIVLNQPVYDSLQLLPIENTTLGKIPVRTEVSSGRDTLFCWITHEIKDSLSLVLRINNMVRDTITIALREIKKPGLEIQWNVKPETPSDIYTPVLLRLNSPLMEYKKGTLQVAKDSVTEPHIKLSCAERTCYLQKIKHDTTDRATRKEAPVFWEEESRYDACILPGTFTDIFGNTNDTLRFSFQTKSLKDYGSIKMKYTFAQTGSSYLVQLVNDRGKFISETAIQSDTTLSYEMLIPGHYVLKIVEDTNRNQRWDTGNYLRNIQPERIFFYPSPLQIRSNWDMEAEWKVQ